VSQQEQPQQAADESGSSRLQKRVGSQPQEPEPETTGCYSGEHLPPVSQQAQLQQAAGQSGSSRQKPGGSQLLARQPEDSDSSSSSRARKTALRKPVVRKSAIPLRLLGGRRNHPMLLAVSKQLLSPAAVALRQAVGGSSRGRDMPAARGLLH
jgi:hypothetical protein